LVLGTTKVPLVLSVADVIVAFSRATDCRSVHGVAIGGPSSDTANLPGAGQLLLRHWKLLAQFAIDIGGLEDGSP
jgi:hypothetical protein